MFCYGDCLRIFFAEPLLSDSKRPLQQRLRFDIVASPDQEQSKTQLISKSLLAPVVPDTFLPQALISEPALGSIHAAAPSSQTKEKEKEGSIPLHINGHTTAFFHQHVTCTIPG